jgi:glycosyltransferase involved in cell wall biosynthesis
MRVALYHNLPPGGALRVVRDFQERVPEDVHVDVFTPAVVDRKAGNPGVTSPGLHRGPMERIASTVPAAALQLRASERTIARRINRGGYDVAYVHPCRLAYTPGLLRHLQLPTLLYLHEVRRTSYEPSYRRGRPARPRALAGWALERLMEPHFARGDRHSVAAADHIICNSEYTSERILACYGRAAEVVRPGVDTDSFRPRAAGGTPRLVLSVGGLERFKNHHVVLDALAHLPHHGRPELGLVYERCDNAYRRQLLERADELGVTVHEHTEISDKKLAELYSSASVTVVAAQLEPLGLVPLESIACGTPVVAVREAGYRETVTHGVNGILVPRSPEELGRAVASVLEGRSGLLPRHRLPGTLSSEWSVRASVTHQVEALRQVAHAFA